MSGPLWVVGIVIAFAGCTTSEVVQCANGRVCPAGTTCDEVNTRCISVEQMMGCDGHSDGDACEFAGTPGTCRGGVCELVFCGDGVVMAPEQCEPTNLAGKTCLDEGYYTEGSLACTGRSPGSATRGGRDSRDSRSGDGP